MSNLFYLEYKDSYTNIEYYMIDTYENITKVTDRLEKNLYAKNIIVKETDNSKCPLTKKIN